MKCTKSAGMNEKAEGINYRDKGGEGTFIENVWTCEKNAICN